MESSRQAARESLAETISSLEKAVPAMNLDEPMILNAVTPHEQIFRTSFGREVGDRTFSSVVSTLGLTNVCAVVVCSPSCHPSLVYGMQHFSMWLSKSTENIF
jgi:hypothetical protein